MNTQKKEYAPPGVEEFGTVASLTAAIGSSSDEDQSEYPSSFPPDTGSFDVCSNSDPEDIC